MYFNFKKRCRHCLQDYYQKSISEDAYLNLLDLPTPVVSVEYEGRKVSAVLVSNCGECLEVQELFGIKEVLSSAPQAVSFE
jgi:hypothetical protein